MAAERKRDSFYLVWIERERETKRETETTGNRDRERSVHFLIYS